VSLAPPPGAEAAGPSPPETPREYLRSLGPGIVVVLTWLGAGDLVAAGVAGGNYGYALMWALALSLALRFVFVSALARYQLCNPRGEGVVDALVRLHPAYAPFLLVACQVFGHVNGASLNAGLGEVSTALLGIGSPAQWSLVWIASALALAFRQRYARIELLFKLFLGLLAISLLGSALWVGPDGGAALRGTLTPALPPQIGPFASIGVVLAMAGAVGGSLMNLVYPDFLDQKGWRGPRYLRVQRLDLGLAVAAMVVLDLAVWTLGAELVHGSGRTIANLEDLTQLLALALGPAGRVLFLLGAFAAIYTSVLGSALGLAGLARRAWTSAQRGTGPAARSASALRVYRATLLVCLVSPTPWLASGDSNFVALTLVANTFSVVLVPALAGGLWWITARADFAGAQHRNRWWENGIMALLFGLALFGASGALRSLAGWI
jgi:Mn2+/Fe2+ NRAMP family transporter